VTRIVWTVGAARCPAAGGTGRVQARFFSRSPDRVSAERSPRGRWSASRSVSSACCAVWRRKNRESHRSTDPARSARLRRPRSELMRRPAICVQRSTHVCAADGRANTFWRRRDRSTRSLSRAALHSLGAGVDAAVASRGGRPASRRRSAQRGSDRLGTRSSPTDRPAPPPYTGIQLVRSGGSAGSVRPRGPCLATAPRLFTGDGRDGASVDRDRDPPESREVRIVDRRELLVQ